MVKEGVLGQPTGLSDLSIWYIFFSQRDDNSADSSKTAK